MLRGVSKIVRIFFPNLEPNFKSHLKIIFIFVCVHVHKHTPPRMCGSQRTISDSNLSPFIIVSED